MITDVQSNKVYFSKRLTWYKCWKELNRVLDEAGIDFDLLENTNDKWVRDYMPVQLEKDKFVSYIYNPDYLQEDKHAMVGEAGIDKRYPGYNDGTQDKIFLEQAKLALELKRDLQIHCVGDYMHVLKLLTEAGFPQEISQGQEAEHLHVLSRLQEAPRPIFHRFGGDANFVKKALSYGALFSLHEDSFRKKSTASRLMLPPSLLRTQSVRA